MQNSYLLKPKITFSGFSFWIGLMLLLLALYGLAFSFDPSLKVISGILLVPGIVLCLSIQYTQLNFTEKTAVCYLKLFIFKIKLSKTPLDDCEQVSLRLYRDNQTMQMLSISSQVITREFELYLKDLDGSDLLIAESTDYQEALEILNILSEGLGLPAVNEYEIWKSKRMKTRRPKDQGTKNR
ncbi:hypothetical protein [Croceimicrobium hydrocarbonivorans]|uniref:Uncharacterized protein n=1 Tax=Croceimicrobium hydrocarbonivorans TaxID=2761580 RepID=A0A7H0VHK8_9FLAO|nr:hypothetical protein [Croceimicrobium hydrocarbonivorans]QNR25206.1 hypothetical protein H4K34_05025 [Croceimicrobium hydrocarbonivorans]